MVSQELPRHYQQVMCLAAAMPIHIHRHVVIGAYVHRPLESAPFRSQKYIILSCRVYRMFQICPFVGLPQLFITSRVYPCSTVRNCPLEKQLF